MKNFIKRLITGIFLVLLGGFILLSRQAWVFPVSLGLILFEIVYLEWPRIADRHPKSYRFTPVPKGVSDPNYFLWSLLLPYVIIPFGLLFILDDQPHGRALIILMCLVASAFDVGAYLLGRLIGRHQLCPVISPNKTWEGVVGGILAVVLMLMLWQIWHGQAAYFSAEIVFLIFLISLFAVLGDLFESWLKRQVGLKDISQILPGHGGLLDRIDSILFMIWLFYFGKDWIVKLLF